MNKQEFKSLGVTRQLAYVNRLEEINRRLESVVKDLESDNKKLQGIVFKWACNKDQLF